MFQALLNNHRMINAFHFLVLGPFLAYIGWAQSQGQPLPEWIWQALLATGILATAYHFFRYNRRVEAMTVVNDETLATYNEGFTSVAGPSHVARNEEEEY